MKLSVYLIILVALFLVACQQVRPTLSPSVTQPPTKSPETPTPTRTRSSPAPTLNPREIASLVLAELSINNTRDLSPNGRCVWEQLLAFSISEAAQRKYDSKFFTFVKVTCGKEWVLVQEWKEQNLGYSIPELLGWSVDGKYVYFYDAIIPDGCQPLGGFQEKFRQVELASGNIRAIPLSWTGGMALSPDSTKLVYYDWESVEVGVYNLVTHEDHRIPFELPEQMEYWYAGNFTWSPDGQSALFVINYGDPCVPSGNSIRRVDIQKNDVSTVVESKDQTLSIVEWTEPDRVLISREESNLWLDPVSGSLQVP